MIKMNRRDEIIKRALMEYVEDKANHYEELAMEEIQFSPGFDRRVKSEIEKPALGIQTLLTKHYKRLLPAVAALLVLLIGGRAILSRIQTPKSTEQVQTATMEESKVAEDSKDTMKTSEESLEDKSEEAPAVAKPEEMKLNEDVEKEEVVPESQTMESAMDMEDAPMVTSQNLVMGLNKPIYTTEDRIIGVYIKNEGNQAIAINDSFKLEQNGNVIERSAEHEPTEIEIPAGSTRYIEVNVEEHYNTSLSSGSYTIEKEIDGVNLVLNFVVE